MHTLLDLNSVITETVRLVSTDVLSRESVVTTELDPHLPQVNATLVQIQQVLLNLIINALDAMEGLPPAERRDHYYYSLGQGRRRRSERA